jgi:anti-sigma28 factor (negative regulator of flagellin synthesis)
VGEVNEARVAELRAKIASGEYRADLKLVAERIIAEAVAFDGL